MIQILNRSGLDKTFRNQLFIFPKSPQKSFTNNFICIKEKLFDINRHTELSILL